MYENNTRDIFILNQSSKNGSLMTLLLQLTLQQSPFMHSRFFADQMPNGIIQGIISDGFDVVNPAYWCYPMTGFFFYRCFSRLDTSLLKI